MNSPKLVDFEIEVLSKKHSLPKKQFNSSNLELNNYLAKLATQDLRRNLAVTYVIVDLKKDRIIGYYTLSSLSVNLGEYPENIQKKLPDYPLIGVTLIGRLAVDIDYSGMGWGKLLIIDAQNRCLNLSKKIASYAVIVEAIDNNAVNFYKRFNFQQFPDNPLKLFRTIKEIGKNFSK